MEDLLDLARHLAILIIVLAVFLLLTASFVQAMMGGEGKACFYCKRAYPAWSKVCGECKRTLRTLPSFPVCQACGFQVRSVKGKCRRKTGTRDQHLLTASQEADIGLRQAIKKNALGS